MFNYAGAVELNDSDRRARDGEQHRKDDCLPVGAIIADGRRETPNHAAGVKIRQHRTSGIKSCKNKMVEGSDVGLRPSRVFRVATVHPESYGEVYGIRWIFDW